MTFAGLPIPPSVAARAWAKISPGEPSACWPWPGKPGNHGYGQIGWEDDAGRHCTTAHRAVWTHHNGTIPDGMTIDHIKTVCAGGPCCNPAHLRLLSNRANATDNGQGRKTHCPQGHAYDETNTYVGPRGDRRCRACAGARFGRAPTTPRRPARCGTPSGYKAHRRRGERACDPCREANTDYYRQRREF